MKKTIILFLFLFIFVGINTSAQNVVVKNDSTFRRFLFPKEHFVLVSVPNQKERYTPNMEDVLKAEETLNNNLRYLEECQMEQNGLSPYIYRCLQCYDRQYFGFINKKGEKILYVNFLWSNRYSSERLAKDIIAVYDGGSYYWSIFINVSREEPFNMSVNGIS